MTLTGQDPSLKLSILTAKEQGGLTHFNDRSHWKNAQVALHALEGTSLNLKVKWFVCSLDVFFHWLWSHEVSLPPIPLPASFTRMIEPSTSSTQVLHHMVTCAYTKSMLMARVWCHQCIRSFLHRSCWVLAQLYTFWQTKPAHGPGY